MHKSIPFLVLGLLGASSLVAWASHSGLGVPQPTKSPVSIREESARGKKWGAGHHRTRYLFGGGIHTGK